MLTEQAVAPDFESLDDQGQPIKLSDYRGQWVVLYFYPKAMTSGCTLQAQSLRDDHAKYQALNAVVLGVSPDSVKRQAKFKQKEGLPFTLVADEDHQVAELYEVWKEKSMFGKTFKGNERTTFLIDPEGRVAKIFPKFHTTSHSNQVLDALSVLQVT
jgi:peroxiredoxin Q/BCP